MALIALILYYYSKNTSNKLYYTEDQAALRATQDDVAFNSYLMDQNYIYTDPKTNLLRGKGIDRSKTGAFILESDAKPKLTRFREINSGIGSRRDIPHYAFAFGLDKLDSLVTRVKRINKRGGLSNSDDKSLQGIRVYLIVSESNFNGTTTEHFDVMMVPVRKDGQDFVQLEKKNLPFLNDEDSVFLNTSAPCPDNCHVLKKSND